jgi:methylenetetrahydrofolate reductase (NADPH)
MSLLAIARTLRDAHRFESGRAVTHAPRVFLGAAANPFVPPYDFRALRTAKKAAAGAQFIQTQYCFDLPRLRDWLRQLGDLGLLDGPQRLFVLVGVGPLRSAKAAEWMRSRVPGVHVPDAVIDRLARADDPAREGRRLCIELIQQLREERGVAGVHLMAYRQEEAVAEIIDASGVLAGRVPWYPERDTAPSLETTA